MAKMAKEERVTIRLGGALRRVLAREAEEQGVTLSEHIRRLLLASRPHLTVLEEVREVLAAGQGVTSPREYLSYLANVVQRLEEGLQALESFELMSAQWRQEAERELREALAHVQARVAQTGAVADMAGLLSKVFEQGARDEDR